MTPDAALRPKFPIPPALALAATATAGEADVVAVDAICDDQGVCRFDVTVAHSDEGWSHYANRWEILTPSGEVLATRVLAHPHEQEQPFTRSLLGVELPPGTTLVIVRAHDSVHGAGGREIAVRVAGD